MAGVPVTVVTGFLGAGKTTLVNAWLRADGGRLAVVVNELGAVGIDGELLAARARELVEITGGCVCCRTQEELAAALVDLASRGAARIVVETSGAASPAGVVRVVASGGPRGVTRLDGIVTVVDASRMETLAESDLAREQLGYADLVVLARADASDAAVVRTARDVVAEQNAAAVIALGATGIVEGAATLDALLAMRAADLPPRVAAPRRAAHGHASVYESLSLTLEGEVDGERFADFVEGPLARFAGRLFRSKGILAVAGVDQRMIVQGVADRLDVTFGEPWGAAPRTSRLVLVGFGLDGKALEAAFAACAASA